MVMFTKAEIVRKFSKLHGVPDEEAKVFFEIFLKKASDKLELGEAINLKDFGYFQLRKGSVKNLSYSFDPEESEEYLINIIIYRSKIEEKGGLIFNVPDVEDDPNFIIDSHFSLSIGKPVIPLAGVKASEFFVPPSGYELRRILDSKAEKIIEENDIISVPEGTELVSIENDSYRKSQYEMDYNSSKVNDESIEVENIPWDFGEDLSRQIEEDSLLDVELDEEYDSPKITQKNSEEIIIESDKSDDAAFQKPVSSDDENEIVNSENIKEKYAGFSERKEGSSKIFWIIVVIIFLIGVGYFLYKMLLDKEDKINPPVQSSVVSNPVTVSRSFEIPVIYPYITSEKNIEFFDPFGSGAEKTDQLNEDIETKSIGAKLNPNAVRTKIKENIYKYDDIFVVQLSSWKSKNRADAQVEQYNKGGYNAFLESINIPDRGLWYRVRVGNFSSLEEAEKFLNQK